MGKQLGGEPRVLGEQDLPLRDQVRDEIRKRISYGKFGPGQRLIEQTLADEFGVSRIPVREALRMLESEGLVETVPRRGVVVKIFSRQDLEHLYEVRTALEVQAFRLAAERGTTKDSRKLQALLKRAVKAMEKEDFAEVSQVNVEFHETVISIAGNPFLSSMLEPLTGRLGLLMGQSHEHERQLAEHSGLAEAIAEHDADRAGAAALAHIRRSRSHALSKYDQMHKADSA